MTSAPVVPILFGGLIVWSIFRRVRRSIGQQPLRPRRAIFSISILTVISVMILGTSAHDLRSMLGFAGGLALGGMLGFLGLRLTRFETTDEGHFYTPNTHIGIALTVLFIGRMAYRFFVMSNLAPGQRPPASFQSPLTLFILGLTVGYYIVYQIGLLIHTHDKK